MSFSFGHVEKPFRCKPTLYLYKKRFYMRNGTFLRLWNILGPHLHRTPNGAGFPVLPKGKVR
jgi:hypothetical protein